MPQVPRVDKFQLKYNIRDHYFLLIMNNSDIQFEICEYYLKTTKLIYVEIFNS